MNLSFLSAGTNGNVAGVSTDMRCVIDLFHRVRRFTYLSDGVRDPDVIAARGAGSCTGKHILLRNLLREAGIKADVEFVQGDFAASIPGHRTMPAALRRMARAGGIVDYHNFVTAEIRGRAVTLDATWHDALVPFGFGVNSDWNGIGNTELAVRAERFFGAREDVIAFKLDCIDRLPRPMKARRERFLEFLSNWIAAITA